MQYRAQQWDRYLVPQNVYVVNSYKTWLTLR